jgi:hypothetical protein
VVVGSHGGQEQGGRVGEWETKKLTQSLPLSLSLSLCLCVSLSASVFLSLSV